MPIRSALYVDGFNLYHALDKLQKPHLKWLNLAALGRRILLSPKDEELVLTRYFTALKTSNPDKVRRHSEYITALQWEKVSVIKGHFISDSTTCKNCWHTWESDAEKETDVNLALHVITDAHKGLFDRAYILSADSDQGATFAMMKKIHPDKTVVTVAPPNMDHSRSILSHTNLKLKLSEAMIAQCLLPPERHRVTESEARLLYRCPPEYALPTA